TASPLFTPTIAASLGPQRPGLDQPDALVARFSADLSRLEWSLLLARSGFDYGSAIALDRFGNIYVTGNTTSGDFPVLSAFRAQKYEAGDPDGQAGYDGFVTGVREDGTLAFSSYLGGAREDRMNAVLIG